MKKVEEAAARGGSKVNHNHSKNKPLFDINPYETSNHPGANRDAPEPKSLMGSGPTTSITKDLGDGDKKRGEASQQGIQLNAWAQSVLGLGPGFRAKEENASKIQGIHRPRSLTDKPEFSSFMQEWLKQDAIGGSGE